MVSALDSGLSGQGLSPGWGTMLCSWERQFTLIVALFTQVYVWIPPIFSPGGNPAMDYHPIQEGGDRVEILLVTFILWKL